MNEIEAKADSKDPKEQASFWQLQLALAEKEQESWVKDGRKVRDRYKGEKNAAKKSDGRKLNILWSNTETLKSALYGKTAKPDVRRRFLDADPTGKEVAELIERSLVYCQDAYDVDTPINSAMEDYLLPGRGVIRIVYEPKIGQQPQMGLDGQPMIGEDGQPAMQDVIVDQQVRETYVFWEDYRQSPARTEADVWWKAFRLTMTKEELAENGFPTDVPLNWSPDLAGKKEKDVPDGLKRAEVWEIWNKKDRTRLFVVNGYDKVLRVDEDPYHLKDFWPCAEPLRSVTTTDSLVPTPEFHLYQDQADELDRITTRISRLTEALKRRGLYDESIPELRRLSNAGDNVFIAAKNYGSLAQKGGLAKAFDTEDLSKIHPVLAELAAQRDRQIQSIYEITGIADVMRGASDPNETATAQQIKSNFGSMRLKRRQREVQRWIRDTYRIKAEIIAEHFEPHVLQEMTGIQVTPEMVQILRSDKLRGYKIDVETDSTVFEDAETEKKARTEVVMAMAGILKEGIPAVQAAPELAPLVFETLSFVVRSHKSGRALEDVIDQVKEAVMAKAQQPPQPDPKIEAEKMKAEAQKVKTQGEMQMMGMDLQVKQAEHGMKMQELAAKQQANQENAMLQAMQPQGGVQ